MILIGFLLIVGCGEENSGHEVKLSQKMAAVRDSLDTYFLKLTELNHFNGVVMAYQNDTLLLNRAYNLNHDQDNSTYVTTDNQFDIHSVSKLMTYYLVAKLESQGRLSTQQTLDMFLDSFPKAEEITIQMLLEHSSGLPRELIGYEGQEYDLDPEEIVRLASNQTFLFEPGSDLQYSNIGYEILYYIISNIYEKPFSQCVMDEIFIPLGMNSSGAHFFVKEDRKIALAQNHVLKDSLVTRVENIRKDEFRTARLFSTAADLKKFLDAVKQNPYAEDLQNKNGVIAKDGGSVGIRAQVYSDLVHGFDFVLLANYDEMPFFKTIDDMAAILKSEPVSFPKEINRKAIVVDAETLQRYEGFYTFADFDGLVLEIRMENNQLVVFQEGEKIASLNAESPTVFFENPKEAESFEFVENEDGTYDVLMGWKGIVVEGKLK